MTYRPLPTSQVAQLDLNLLPKFRALYRRRNVSNAAIDLNLTQSAVSNALAKMRQVFGDKLFVRTADGMVPTPMAQAIAEKIEAAMTLVETGLDQATPFDPRESGRTFNIAVTHLAEAWLLPSLLSLTHHAAPNIVISTVKGARRGFEDDLRVGNLDFAIGDFPELGPGFRDQNMSAHAFVCILRRDHPLFLSALTREAVLDCSFIEVVEHGAKYSEVSRAVMRRAREPSPRLRTANVLSLPYFVASTDLLAILPEFFARRSAEAFGLAMLPYPLEMIPVTTMSLAWHDSLEQDRGHVWMRAMITQADALAVSVSTQHQISDAILAFN